MVSGNLGTENHITSVENNGQRGVVSERSTAAVRSHQENVDVEFVSFFSQISAKQIIVWIQTALRLDSRPITSVTDKGHASSWFSGSPGQTNKKSDTDKN